MCARTHVYACMCFNQPVYMVMQLKVTSLVDMEGFIAS